jgi:transcriptional regulator GlxA family with amidase domain
VTALAGRLVRGFRDLVFAPRCLACGDPVAAVARDRFPRLSVDARRPIVEGERILMGAGPAADAELMVRLFSRAISEEAGRWLGALTGIDRETEAALSRDPLVANAQLWLEQRFAQDVRIAELARAMSSSHQTLIRRFVRELGVRPKDYVQNLRVGAAQRMLHRTHRSIEEIAAMVGYRDARSIRAVFREETGTSPSAHRQAVRAAPRGARQLASV